MLRGLAHTLAALFGNCGDFQRRWNDVDKNAQPPTGVAGRWTGEWRSEENGHHGALRCVTEAVSQGCCAASFHARYGGILRVCYRVRLELKPEEEAVVLHGQTDLGRLAGGIYTYEGTIRADQFTCRYRCRYDHGIFELQRLSHQNSSITG